MPQDLTDILNEWPYEPGRILARVLTDDAGNQWIQVRLDLGILQMHADGRPDGQRPNDFDSLLDYYEDRAAAEADDRGHEGLDDGDEDGPPTRPRSGDRGSGGEPERRERPRGYGSATPPPGGRSGSGSSESGKRGPTDAWFGEPGLPRNRGGARSPGERPGGEGSPSGNPDAPGKSGSSGPSSKSGKFGSQSGSSHGFGGGAKPTSENDDEDADGRDDEATSEGGEGGGGNDEDRFSLSPEECGALRDEAAQYVQRSVACMAVEDFRRALRDAVRNFRVLSLCAQFARDEEDRGALEAYRGQLLILKTKALAAIAVSSDEPAAAVIAIDDGLDALRKWFLERGVPRGFEESHEVESLREMRAALAPARVPVSQRVELQDRLQRALTQENYELAAILRDEIRALKDEAKAEARTESGGATGPAGGASGGGGTLGQSPT